jgi:hypothetical protein
MAVKRCPGFRRATSSTCGSSNKSEQRILRVSGGSMPNGPRRNKRLFWRQEISPSPGNPGPPIFRSLNFFTVSLFFPFPGLLLGLVRYIRMMLDHQGFDHEDHPLGDVGCVVGDALQASADDDQMD